MVAPDRRGRRSGRATHDRSGQKPRRDEERKLRDKYGGHEPRTESTTNMPAGVPGRLYRVGGTDREGSLLQSAPRRGTDHEGVSCGVRQVATTLLTMGATTTRSAARSAALPTARPRGATPRSARRASGRATYLAILAFLAAAGTVHAHWPLSYWIIGTYLATSAVCFGFYAADKSAARSGDWRVCEKTLLLTGLLGGWPGAIVAQQVLRHKTQKASFRVAFWASVVANAAIFVLVATPVLRIFTE